ncbi:class I adenylate-forming enzyme family protein [Corynebacterium frankenforstense]|uniref:class I adenylate-forming enzyme family protein n=1 Tax=Corynebacterium frankenforstense TaxID=1230998 RepID=UPI0026EE5283|nr:AMP-binding protein [Corynebacterium frankenforstense]
MTDTTAPSPEPAPRRGNSPAAASRGIDPTVPPTGLAGLVLGGLSVDDAARTAVTDTATGRQVTYGDLAERVSTTAAVLRACLSYAPSTDAAESGATPAAGSPTAPRSTGGITVPPVVVLNAPNSLGFIVAFFAALAAGAAVSPAGAQLGEAEIAGQLKTSGARLILTATEAGAAAAEATGIPVLRLDRDGLVDLADGEAAPQAQPLTAPEDRSRELAVLPFSSGTTGRPKPVMLTHANLCANVRQMAAALERCPAPAHWTMTAPLPFAHVYGLTVLMCTTLFRRGHLVVFDGFDPATFLKLHERHAVNFSWVAPAILAHLVRDGVPAGVDLSALKVMLSGADTLSGGLARRAAEALGCEVIQGYGLSEASPVTHVHVRGEDPAGIGTPVPGTEVAVVRTPDGQAPPVELSDAARAELVRASAVGETGEMWVRGPQVMAGYLGMPEATAAAVTPDGWLRTGDVVEIGPDGVADGQVTGADLRVIGRVKEIINCNGFQVSPAEVEESLRAHPLIADAAVAAWRKPSGGETPRAVVVLRDAAKGVRTDGQSETRHTAHTAGSSAEAPVSDPSALAEELREWVRAGLAAYKVPVRVEVVAAVPRTATGKVARTRLSRRWNKQRD